MRRRLRLSLVALLALVVTAGGAAPAALAGPSTAVDGALTVAGPGSHERVAARAGGSFVSRIGSLNLPGGDFRQQKRLLDQPKRTRAALNFLEDKGVSIVAMQELSTPSRKMLWRSPKWGVVSAPANSVRGRSEIGNAVAYQSRKWVRVRGDSLHIPVASRPRGLNMAVATLRRRGTGTRIVVMSIHHPVKTEVNAKRVRERSKKLEIAYMNRVRRQTGYPVVIAGDTNERDAQGTYRRAGYDLGIRHVVDLITAKGVRLTSPRVFVEDVYLRFTDHALVTSVVRLPR